MRIRHAPTCRRRSKIANDAGIRVVMVTGDHAVTARSIGQAIGLGGSATTCSKDVDIARLADTKNSDLLEADIFARVSPEEKLALVRAYQDAGRGRRHDRRRR